MSAEVTAMLTSWRFAVSETLPVTEPLAAWMLVVPTPTTVANPWLLIVATEVEPDVQVTSAVRFLVELSL